MKTLTRRQSLYALGAGLAGVVLAACSGRAQPVEQKAEPIAEPTATPTPAWYDQGKGPSQFVSPDYETLVSIVGEEMKAYLSVPRESEENKGHFNSVMNAHQVQYNMDTLMSDVQKRYNMISRFGISGKNWYFIDGHTSISPEVQGDIQAYNGVKDACIAYFRMHPESVSDDSINQCIVNNVPGGYTLDGNAKRWLNTDILVASKKQE